MKNCAIRLETGQLWRSASSSEHDPFRSYPELFDERGTTRDPLDVQHPSPEFTVTKTRDSFSLSAILPGVTAAQVEVRVTAQLLVVLIRAPLGSVSPAGADASLPKPSLPFRKTFVLPPGVDGRRSSIRGAGDLLTITLPMRRV